VKPAEEEIIDLDSLVEVVADLSLGVSDLGLTVLNGLVGFFIAG